MKNEKRKYKLIGNMNKNYNSKSVLTCIMFKSGKQTSTVNAN